MAKLTKRFIDGLQPGKREQFVWDDQLLGFGLRLFPSGKRGEALRRRACADYGLAGHEAKPGLISPTQIRLERP